MALTGLRDVAASCRQGGPNSRAVPVGPGRLCHDAAQVRVAGFADGAAAQALATRVLVRDCPRVTHELARVGKAGEFAEFGDERHRGDPGDAAQRLKALDSFPDPQHNPRSANRGPVVP